MDSLARPTISVIMPVYNAELYVACAIESILNQTFSNIELLVLDDASTDGSLSVIESYKDSRIRLYKHTENKGYLKSVNFLFSQCSGDYIAFQDADDWSDISRLQSQLIEFQKDPELMFCGTQCVYSKHGREQRRSSFPQIHSDVIAQLERGDTVVLCGASVMLQRELLTEYSGYREFFDRIGAEHLDWFWRMLINHKYINIPEHLYTYRSNMGSFTRKLDLNPLKYHSTQIALLAYWQRKLYGKDVLDDKTSSLALVNKIEAKYRSDESLIYRQAAVTQLAFGQFSSYAWCLRESIARKGVTLDNIKLMLIWLPLFVFLHLSPKRLQRKIVENKNQFFLKEMGIDIKKAKLR